MGTNYYFRKKNVKSAPIEAVVDELNNEYRALIQKYNDKLHNVFSEMGIDCECEFDDGHLFITPYSHDTFGDIHVGKLSYGWKPLMQANKHFNSIPTLKQWYEENRNVYNFIDEDDRVMLFEDFLQMISKRNKDDKSKKHEHCTSSDGYDWTYTDFS